MTRGVDGRARDFAVRCAEAVRVAEQGQAALARIFAEAAAEGMQRVAELASPSSREAELPFRSLAAELGAATNMSDRTVQRRLNDAAVLEESFPATFAAWDEGRVSGGHVAVIMEHGLPSIDPEARAVFEAEALLRAEETTPGRLGASLARLAESLQPGPLAERHQEARALRGACVRDIGDGMAEFISTQPAVLAHAMHDRITQQAHAIKQADPTDTRTLDQIRADLVADMVLTTTPSVETGAGFSDGFGGLGAIKAIVNVTFLPLRWLGSRTSPPNWSGAARSTRLRPASSLATRRGGTVYSLTRSPVACSRSTATRRLRI